MAEIIPAIIAKNFKELEEKVKLVEPYIKTVQLDIMDGVFVLNETWREPADLEKLETSLFLEAHLMVAEPEKIIDEWLESKVDRIIVHYEAINTQDVIASPARVGRSNPVMRQPFLDGGNPRDRHAFSLAGGLAREDNSYNKILNLVKKIHKAGKQFGISLNSKTPIEVLDNFINEVNLVLLMSVNPGSAGQEFQESVFLKIQALRQKYPNVKIGVDGGIDLLNAAKLAKAGANFLAVGSAIFAGENIENIIKELKKLTR